MSEAERRRLQRVFQGYGSDPGRAWAWSGANAGNAAMREELASELLALMPGDDDLPLLDIGCGTGWWLERLLRHGVPPSRLIGVDLLPERAEAARERVPGARVLCADARALPIASGSCALVTLLTVLSGTEDRTGASQVMGEARRVLAPGGTIAVWEPRVPTRNADTHLVRRRDLRRGFGTAISARSITLAPPLARRLPRAYRVLAALPVLRSHRLVLIRPG